MNTSSVRVVAPPFGVRIDPSGLRHAMRLRGLTGAELARRAKVSEATISHALNGRRIHPATFRAINDVLQTVPPLAGAEALVSREEAVMLSSVHEPALRLGSRTDPPQGGARRDGGPRAPFGTVARVCS